MARFVDEPDPNVKSGDMVRIVNESGIGRKTEVTLLDGTPIRFVRGAKIEIPLMDLVTVDLEIIMPKVDVTARVKSVTQTCPYCGHSETDEEARLVPPTPPEGKQREGA